MLFVSGEEIRIDSRLLRHVVVDNQTGNILVDALRDALGREVDLVEDGSVTDPCILAEINRSRELVYAA